MTLHLSMDDYDKLLNKKSRVPRREVSGSPLLPTGDNKYGNKRCVFNNIKFDSILERDRYIVLNDMAARGEIHSLLLQPVFALEINSMKICDYRADFSYIDKAGLYHVEDAKGVKTKEYSIKKKLMAAILGIEIEEIFRHPPKKRAAAKASPKTAGR